MKIYKKKVKRHEEVWADVPDQGEGRVKVCIGNSNYGRFYVEDRPKDNDYAEGWGFWLDEKETEEALALFKEIWEVNIDNHPFSYD